MSRGKWAILTMVLLGCALGGYAVWHHYRQGRRILEFWGSEAAMLIRHADQVEVWRLGPQADQSRSQLQVVGQSMAVLEQVEISSLRGLVHARHALIIDRNYDWSAAPEGQSVAWNLALHFREDGQQATLVFATDSRLACVAGRTRVVRVTQMMDRVVEFVTPHLDGAIGQTP
ncbi:MAG: hypothetical protein VX346_20475 [Planctomycetota bacterium]|nr:hypothetical protein [Planctomycetota bacterium]